MDNLNMTAPKPKSRLPLLVVALLVVAAIGVGLYFFLGAQKGEEEAPPSLETSAGAGFQGFIGTQSGFLKFESSDVDNFQGFGSCTPIAMNSGVNYYYADEDLTAAEIIDRIEPIEGNQMLLAFYSPGEAALGLDKAYYTYPEGPFVNTELMDLDQMIPAYRGFAVILKEATNGCFNSAKSAPASFVYHLADDESGWVLVPMSACSDLGVFANKSLIVWSQDGDNSYSKVEEADRASNCFNGDYRMVWLKIGEAGSAGSGNLNLGTDTNVPGEFTGASRTGTSVDIDTDGISSSATNGEITGTTVDIATQDGSLIGPVTTNTTTPSTQLGTEPGVTMPGTGLELGGTTVEGTTVDTGSLEIIGAAPINLPTVLATFVSVSPSPVDPSYELPLQLQFNSSTDDEVTLKITNADTGELVYIDENPRAVVSGTNVVEWDGITRFDSYIGPGSYSIEVKYPSTNTIIPGSFKVEPYADFATFEVSSDSFTPPESVTFSFTTDENASEPTQYDLKVYGTDTFTGEIVEIYNSGLKDVLLGQVNYVSWNGTSAARRGAYAQVGDHTYVVQLYDGAGGSRKNGTVNVLQALPEGFTLSEPELSMEIGVETVLEDYSIEPSVITEQNQGKCTFADECNVVFTIRAVRDAQYFLNAGTMDMSMYRIRNGVKTTIMKEQSWPVETNVLTDFKSDSPIKLEAGDQLQFRVHYLQRQDFTAYEELYTVTVQ